MIQRLKNKKYNMSAYQKKEMRKELYASTPLTENLEGYWNKMKGSNDKHKKKY